MRDRKKRNIIIGSLCCLLVFMGIGYAILSQTLNISGIANMKGNWNVRITNMELLSENKTGRAEEVSHSFTDTTATFTADLYMPGDSIEYRVTVENQGNIDALLKSITPTTTNKSEGIKFSHSQIDNTVLTAGKTITFTMKVEFLEEATSIPKVENVKYNLELVYVQYDGKSEYTPAVETTEDSCFMISDDGTLLSYDRSCGGDTLVIPAKVNNIPVKRIQPYFLIAGGEVAILQKTDDGYSMSNLIQKDKLNKIVEILKNKFEYTDEDLQSFTSSFKIYEDTDIKTLNPATFKDIVVNYRSKTNYKVSKKSDGTYNLEETTSDTDYNLIKVEDRGRDQEQVPAGWYCKNQEDCQLFKEALCSLKADDYADNADNCKEYMDNFDFPILDDLNYIYYSQQVSGFANYFSFKKVKVIDLSQAIYMDDFSFDGTEVTGFNDDGDEATNMKVILPPNLKTLRTIVREEGVPISGYKSSITELAFPSNSTTTAIDYAAFKWLDLNSLNLPKSLKIIGRGAFVDSTFSKVTIPQSVRIIANTTVDMNDTSETIPLSEIQFESGSKLIEIGNNAFNKASLTNITIPASVEKIGKYAFYGNKLSSVTFGAGSKLKEIGYSAFSTNQLTNTGLSKLPSSLTKLDTYAFSGNSNLTQITLTSPTDIDGWVNGSTVDGKTVVYER